VIHQSNLISIYIDNDKLQIMNTFNHQMLRWRRRCWYQEPHIQDQRCFLQTETCNNMF